MRVEYGVKKRRKTLEGIGGNQMFTPSSPHPPHWWMTACRWGMWRNEWTDAREQREGRMTSQQSLFPANPSTTPSLPLFSTLLHLSVVATAAEAAPSHLCEALFIGLVELCGVLVCIDVDSVHSRLQSSMREHGLFFLSIIFPSACHHLSFHLTVL